MIKIRPSAERGHVNHGWLDTYHTFSFSSYQDPAHMGISNLRVINEDRIAPGGGFPTHGHEDMEIVTYVLEGALAHKDSMGNGSTIAPGDVQYMSAGTGVRHSEYNASSDEPVHLLQIWLLPNEIGVEPGYGQQHFPESARRNRLALLVSPDGRDGSIAAHQDALLFGALLDEGSTLEYPLAADRQAYVQVARGELRINDHLLQGGDAAHITGEMLRLGGLVDAEVLLFDLP